MVSQCQLKSQVFVGICNFQWRTGTAAQQKFYGFQEATVVLGCFGTCSNIFIRLCLRISTGLVFSWWGCRSGRVARSLILCHDVPASRFAFSSNLGDFHGVEKNTHAVQNSWVFRGKNGGHTAALQGSAGCVWLGISQCPAFNGLSLWWSIAVKSWSRYSFPILWLAESSGHQPYRTHYK